MNLIKWLLIVFIIIVSTAIAVAAGSLAFGIIQDQIISNFIAAASALLSLAFQIRFFERWL